MTDDEKEAAQEWMALAMTGAGKAEGFSSYAFKCPHCPEVMEVLNGLDMGPDKAGLFLVTSNTVAMLVSVVAQHVIMKHGLELAMHARTGKASKN